MTPKVVLFRRASMRDRAERITSRKPLQTIIYWLQYLIVITILGFPLAAYEGYFHGPRFWYEAVCGSVVRFGPAGGKIASDVDVTVFNKPLGGPDEVREFEITRENYLSFRQ